MTLIGRGPLLRKLTTLLADERNRVVSLYGESGVGKTMIALQLYNDLEQSRFERSVRRVAWVPETERAGLGRSLLEGLTASIATELAQNQIDEASDNVLPRNATSEEYLAWLLEDVARQPTLVLLDNAETFDEVVLRTFVRSWSDSEHASTLLLTTTNPNALVRQRGIRRVKIPGLRPSAAIEAMGSEISARFDRSNLVAVAKKLKGNPQRIAQLRWVQPNSVRQLNTFAAAQARAAKPGGKAAFFGELKFAEHFFALGRARVVEFDEDLLAFLWDRLVRRSSDEFVKSREELKRRGLLVAVQGTRSRFRIHPSIPVMLERQLSSQIGEVHLQHVDYYLAEYYRRRLHEPQPDELLDPSDLDHYVRHSVRAENIDGCLGYLFKGDRIGHAHFQASAWGVRSAFEFLDGELSHRLDKAKKAKDEPRTDRVRAITRLLAETKLELARCMNDLSDHTACLGLLDEVDDLLSKSDDPADLQAQANYLRGISYSDLGDSEHSIESYERVVLDAPVAGTEAGQAYGRVLQALGYLAFEQRFFDAGIALKHGQRAVELAMRSGFKSVLAKNACSLAQIAFFAGKLDDSKRNFKLAKENCEEDRREMGRVFIHASMIPIRDGDFAEATRQLDAAAEINRANRDRRRMATASALMGICRFHQSDSAGSYELLRSAIRKHADLGDWRNVLMEVFTLHFFLSGDGPRSALAKSETNGAPVWLQTIRGVPEHVDVKRFEDYWMDSFRPNLLDL